MKKYFILRFIGGLSLGFLSVLAIFHPVLFGIHLALGTYDSLIIRDADNAAALIPEEVTAQIFQDLPQMSATMSLFTRLPNMSRKQLRMPVLNLLPTAYFVDGDYGLKQTTEQQWKNKYINAEEIAVIVPIPEAVLNDVDYDIWGQVQPRLVQAIGKTWDAAVIHGTNKPSTWPSGIVTGATSAGTVVALGTGVDIYEDILGASGVISLIEQKGYMSTGHIAAMSMRGKLRGLRDADGLPIFNRAMTDKTQYQLDGETILFPRNGALDPTAALLITGDFSQAVYSIRQDLTFKILTEGVVQDSNGAIVYNFAQQDMVGLRVVMRAGWEIPNPVNPIQPTEASRYPFGVLTP